jgi:hypothetical protein
MPSSRKFVSEDIKKISARAKNLIRIHGKEKEMYRDQEYLTRCNELGNRARRSFNNDGPGGNYNGF